MSAALVLYLIALVLLVLLVLSPFILTLFGFFETKTNGSVSFKSGRYAGSILVSIVAAAILVPVAAFFITQLVIDGAVAATDSTKLNRATQLHFQESVAGLFPEIKEKNDCYTKALSNWVEDSWQKAYREATCSKGTCANNQEEFINQFNKKYLPHQYGLITMMAVSFGMIGQSVSYISASASHHYGRIRSFTGILDPTEIGKPNIGTDKVAYDEYHSYINGCQAMQLKPWIVLKEPLFTSPASLCIGECQ